MKTLYIDTAATITVSSVAVDGVELSSVFYGEPDNVEHIETMRIRFYTVEQLRTMIDKLTILEKRMVIDEPNYVHP